MSARIGGHVNIPIYGSIRPDDAEGRAKVAEEYRREHERAGHSKVASDEDATRAFTDELTMEHIPPHRAVFALSEAQPDAAVSAVFFDARTVVQYGNAKFFRKAAGGEGRWVGAHAGRRFRSEERERIERRIADLEARDEVWRPATAGEAGQDGVETRRAEPEVRTPEDARRMELERAMRRVGMVVSGEVPFDPSDAGFARDVETVACVPHMHKDEIERVRQPLLRFLLRLALSDVRAKVRWLVDRLNATAERVYVTHPAFYGMDVGGAQVATAIMHALARATAYKMGLRNAYGAAVVLSGARFAEVLPVAILANVEAEEYDFKIATELLILRSRLESYSWSTVVGDTFRYVDRYSQRDEVLAIVEMMYDADALGRCDINVESNTIIDAIARAGLGAWVNGRLLVAIARKPTLFSPKMINRTAKLPLIEIRSNQFTTVIAGTLMATATTAKDLATWLASLSHLHELQPLIVVDWKAGERDAMRRRIVAAAAGDRDLVRRACELAQLPVPRD